MYKQIFIKLILLLVPCLVYAQHNTEKKLIRDFDSDLFVDTVFYLKSRDNGSTYIKFRVVYGKGKDFTVRCSDTFSSFFLPFLIKDDPDGQKSIIFSKVITETYLPPAALKTTLADASLRWLIDAYCSTVVNEDEDPKEKLASYFTYHPVWLEGKVSIPQDYCLELFTDSLRKLMPCLDKVSAGWLIYKGQEPVRLVKQKGEVSIYINDHAVIVKKGEAYSWVFITDGQVTFAPEELDSPTIKKVEVVDDLVFIYQGNLYIVDYNKGKGISINPTYIHPQSWQIKDFYLQNNKVIIKSNAGERTLSIEEIKNLFE